MFGYDDSVGFGYVGNCVFGEGGDPFVLGQGIEQNAFLHFTQKVDTVKNVAQEIVDLDAHCCVEVIEVGRGQHLLRIADLDAQSRQLNNSSRTGRWQADGESELNEKR